jgi:HK97 family phage prohead protease
MMREIEYRKASTVEVRHAERVIDMIAAPYNEEAEVFLRRQQRWVIEEFAPSAFIGVSGSVFVNRAHDAERPVGRVLKFHPGDVRGLRTEIRVARTSEGDDILELADEGLLSPSVGFTVPPGGERWSEDRRKRTVIKAAVEHIALTGDPAYRGAKVLEVRSDPDLAPVRVPTPNLDRIRLEQLVAGSGMECVTVPGVEE